MTKILDALNWRYAVKKFDTKKIPQEKLDILLESLRLTPSSFGMQAWKFIIVKNPEIREKLVPVSWNQKQVADASHLLVLARPEDVQEDDAEKWSDFLAETQKTSTDKKEAFSQVLKSYINSLSQQQKDRWLDVQLYIALGNLMTVCAIEGIDSCPMEGFDKAKYDEILQLKKWNLKSVLICPIGYRAADDPYQHKEKARYPLSDLVLEI